MTEATKPNYKSTLNLPKTDFAMKANLSQNEPASQKRWESMKLYEAVVKARDEAAAAPFVFHDGPPYANGSIHVGHLLNKVLKDIVVRSRLIAGFQCRYIPGWDCHGLPIEHKVMTELQEAGKLDKLNTLTDDQRRMAIRRECAKYAEKYVKLQAGQMKRLLTLADYDDPYLTMEGRYERAVLEVFAELLERGLVFRALKPVHWSIANETALAEAELEYYDRQDPAVYVDFEALDREAVAKAFGLDEEALDQTPSFMIWTTTPWTLPANVGVAVHENYRYALVKVDGNVAVIASDLVAKVTKAAGAESVEILAETQGKNLLGLRYRHPFVVVVPACGLGRPCDPNRVWSVVAAPYVTLEDGTGLVHTAPGHGAEDYQTGVREELPVYCPVEKDGTFDNTAPDWLRGMKIWDANPKIIDRLRESGHLFHHHVITHSYPHDWRGKSPVIFRATEQWFIGVDAPLGHAAGGHAGKSLRELALGAIGADEATRAHIASVDSRTKATERQINHPSTWNDESKNAELLQLDREAASLNAKMARTVQFVPEWGRNRMRGMLESRPDWCISRQRAWGLPIPAFQTRDGGVIMTPRSVRAVAARFGEAGSDAWFTESPEQLLGNWDPGSDHDLPEGMRRSLDKSTLTKIYDIFDVWFESGSSWNAVMRQRGQGYPADLYLEGSDQHRGWFQLSMLPALGATGSPPFKTLLTHGFMVDKDGKKMSKSLGNALNVDDLLKNYGADVLRWWVSSLAFENDIKVDLSFFDAAGESYRKVRNTLRFLLSNLYDFSANEAVDLKSIAPASLDGHILQEAAKLQKAVLEAYAAYEFRKAHLLLFDFCNETLSAFYCAATKDRLYCDKPDSPRRRATQTVMRLLAETLCRLLAPILPHTADEAYRALQKDDAACVQAQVAADFDFAADPDWASVPPLRDAALKAMEAAKAAGIDNPLDAEVVLPASASSFSKFKADLPDMLGVSRVTFGTGDSITIRDLRNEPRCERSWKRDGTVKQRSDGGMLSDRDAAAVGV